MALYFQIYFSSQWFVKQQRHFGTMKKSRKHTKRNVQLSRVWHTKQASDVFFGGFNFIGTNDVEILRLQALEKFIDPYCTVTVLVPYLKQTKQAVVGEVKKLKQQIVVVGTTGMKQD